MARLILVRAIVQFGMAIIKVIVTFQRTRDRLKMKQEIKKRVSANFWLFAVSRRVMFNTVADVLDTGL